MDLKNKNTEIVVANGINNGSVSLVKIEMNLKLTDVFNKPIFREVFKNNSELAFTTVKTLCTRFVNSFGFSSKLTNDQIEILTIDIMERFAYETLDDIILFFKMARTGAFGTTNRGIDSNLILGEWFPKYMEKKADKREENYKKEKSDRISNNTSIEDVKKTYKLLEEKKRKESVILYIDKITQNIDRQMLEDLIVDWSKDKEKNKFINLLKIKRKSIK